jgi:adhesin/invasin
MAMSPGLNDEITVSPADPNGDDQPANGTSANKAVIRYAEYETDPGATVDLTLSGMNCHFEDGTTNMNKVPLNNGSVTVPFYSTTSSYVALTAYLTSNHRKYGSRDFHFAQAVKTVDLEVVPGYDTAPPDGSTADKVKATVYGYDGKGVAHIAVTFQPTPDATLIPAQPENTKPDGTATVSITNTVAGDVQVTAVAGGVKSDKPVTVHFSNSSLGVKAVDLQVDPTTAPADGSKQIKATATVTMSDGSLAPDGMSVNFEASNGATCSSPNPVISGGSGQATTWITSETTGPSTVSASAGDVSSNQVTVQFTNPPVTQWWVALDVDPTTVPADGTTAARARATVKVSGGGPAPDGTSVTFTATNGATADPPSPTTNGGYATSSITSTKEGDSSVQAIVGDVKSNPVTVHFSKPALTVNTVDLQVDPQAAPADGKTAVRATATVAMSDGSRAPDGTSVAFTATNGATADPPTQKTSGGQAASSITSNTPGVSQVSASVGDVSSESVPVQFKATPSSVAHIDLTVEPQKAPADWSTTVKATAKLTMADGSEAPDGTQVKFIATNGATANPMQVGTTGGHGQAETHIKSQTEGTSEVTATFGDVSSNTVPVTFTSVPSKEVGSIAMLPVPLLVGAAPDGVATILVVATVFGPDGALVADGTAVTFSADSSANKGGQTTIDNPQGQTKLGLATTTVRSTVKGWRTITASAGGKFGMTTIYFGYGQYVETVDLSVDPNNQSYRGVGGDVLHANVYLDDQKTVRAPKGVLLKLEDLSFGGKLNFSTADGNPPETNDQGVVTWNVHCGEAGDFRVKVVADNGREGTTTVSFIN